MDMEKKLTATEITELHKKDVPKAPTIGCKNFEPNGTFEELSEIQNHLGTTKDVISFSKIQKIGSLSQAKWHPNLKKAEVIYQVGSYWSKMGHTTDKKLYLFPEEALYLLEMGVLELQYNDVTMSVQRAYSTLLEPLTDVTLDCYRVYSHLTGIGYKVLRHIQSNIFTKYEKQLQIHKAGVKIKMSNTENKMNKLIDNTDLQEVELKKQKLENLTDIFPISVNGENEDYLEKLRIFKSYKSNLPSTLHVHYDIYLCDGKTSFKKTCLQLPKVRVVVHRGSDPMPGLKDIYHLVQQFEDEVPIVHAVVFPEFISFYTITPTTTPVCT